MSAMEKTVRKFVELIARGDYEAVATMTGGVRMTAADLREEVEDYGYELSAPGPGWWERVTVTPIDDADPPEFHVAAPLWEPDGESELTLELGLKQVSEEEFETRVHNLHVL